MFHVLTYGQGNMPAFSSSAVARRPLERHLARSPAPGALRSGPCSVAFSGSGQVVPRELCGLPRGRRDRQQHSERVAPDPGFHQPGLANVANGNGDRQSNRLWLASSDAVLPLQAPHGRDSQVWRFTCVPLPAMRGRLNLQFRCRRRTSRRPTCMAPFASPATIPPARAIRRFALRCRNFRTSLRPPGKNPEPMRILPIPFWKAKGKFMLPMTDKLGSVDVKQMVALVRGFKGGKQVIPLETPKAPGPPAPVVVTAPTAILSTPGLPTRDSCVEEPLVAPSDESAARIRIGASIFQQYCIVCHGPDGTGSIMRPSMPRSRTSRVRPFTRNIPTLRSRSASWMARGRSMPANRGRVTDEQATDLMAYIRAFGPTSV